ncbi:MAG: GspE/PulE family protein [Bacteroidetes bacterium]|nr:GspE/PulE family protein [Bacteroidota bacterium]MBU1421607.1 GspE/PulE family protein [Bacteroidota bacterium]MBU2471149.1 GspE/PulE family protein [Bacteroidota bacterium]MBU2636816.1 GspE/PulE family protein [Bacteroidota bacterium]
MVKEDLILTEAIIARNLMSSVTFERIKSKIGEHYLIKGISDTLVRFGEVDEYELAKLISDLYDIPMMTITEEVKNGPKEVLPASIIQKYRVIPVFLLGSELTVAFIDPPYKAVVETLKKETGYKIIPVVTTVSDYQQALKVQKAGYDELDKIMPQINIEELDIEKGGDRLLHQMETIGNSPPMKKFVDEIFLRAIKMGASDIHFEPSDDEFRIRVRVDGILRKLVSLPKKLHLAVVSVIKIKANMDLFERRIPQDGRIGLNIANSKFDLRINTLPTIYGEKVVSRILRKSSILMALDEIGFLDQNLELFRTLLFSPNGLILVTGPTGSGKSTTLYAALNEIKSMEKNIITVENPVEYNVDLINQVQIEADSEFNFASALRAILRQDPNAILVGEIRDSDTGTIATEAALTGHIVMSTLHTNDAIGTIPRILNLGVPKFWLAPALLGVVSQRLVKRICSQCKEEYKPSEKFYVEAGLSRLPKDKIFYKGRGCNFCNGSGYRGRIAIHEILMVNEEIRELIYENAPSYKIREVALRYGFREMRLDGIIKALAGIVAIDEVVNITRPFK